MCYFTCSKEDFDFDFDFVSNVADSIDQSYRDQVCW